MKKIIDIVLSPEKADSEAEIRAFIQIEVNQPEFEYRLLKRSIDARSKQIKVNLRFEVYIGENKPAIEFYVPKFPSVKNKKHVTIAGCGPAGIFAALKLIERGLKPVIFERGKNIKDRRRDLALINQKGIVNPESNYCFGEGGAGTYSDGKLYTRSDKRGDVKNVLETFVRFGADENILTEAHPHIGTNKLPKIIESMRNTILNAGGEIHFNSKITDIRVSANQFTGIEINGADTFKSEYLILATGHSARDIFEILSRRNILIEAKPFALGIRIEHPQSLIDKMQYKRNERGQYLPPASYSIVEQTGNKSAYSFCMCPGGIIAPCATNVDEVVTNGWSPSKRNNPFANSGFVVNVDLNDLNTFKKFGPLAGIYFQRSVEQACFIAGGKNQMAPAQRMVDFTNQKISSSLPACSYQPGIISTQLDEVLPFFIAATLRSAFINLSKTKKEYFTNDAVCVAVESRTSSPVRIPRNKETMEHVQVKGLYPCAEGAGYAGGIMSAALDGIRTVMKI